MTDETLAGINTSTTGSLVVSTVGSGLLPSCLLPDAQVYIPLHASEAMITLKIKCLELACGIDSVTPVEEAQKYYDFLVKLEDE